MKNYILLGLPICMLLLSSKVQAQSIYTEAGATLYLTGTAVVDGAVSASPTLYTEGTIQNTGTIQNAGEIQTQGNFVSTGTFSSTGDEAFIGSATQSISGYLKGTNAFSHLIVNKISNPLTLNDSVDVTTQINLENGKIVLGTNDLTLAASGTITGYDAIDYIMTDNTGVLKQTVASTNVVFPVGNSSYNPATINNAGITDVFSARVADAVACGGANTLSTTAKVNRMWYLSEATAGGSNATITTQWNTTDELAGFSRGKSGLMAYNGSAFDLTTTPNTAATSVSTNVWTQTKSGQTSISPRIVTSLSPFAPTSLTDICPGTGATLEAPVDADFSYAWSKNGSPVIPTVTTPTYNITTSGTYSALLTSAGGCTLQSPLIVGTVVATSPAPTITSTSGVSGLTVCAGSSITLTGSPAAEYAWYKNGVFVKYDVAPNASYTATIPEGTTTFSLVVIYSGICPSTAAANFTVIGDAPVAVITPSAAPPYCVGAAPTLNATPPTGTGYTYSWIGASPSATTTTTATFVPTSSGNHRVIVTNAMGCKKTSPWLPITLNALPAAYGGADKGVCLGSSVTIGASSIAGLTYSWSPSTYLGATANSAMPTVSPTAIGSINYTLTVTRTATGCKNTDVVNVAALALPITPTLNSTASPVCGGSITLTPSGIIAGGTINWYKNGVLNLTTAYGQGRTFGTPTTNPDNYTIRNNLGGCLSAESNVRQVHIKAAPNPTLTATPAIVSNNLLLCAATMGNTAQLMANLPSGSPTVASYTWQQYVSNVYTNIPGATGSSYTVTATPSYKSYRLLVTYSNLCLRSTPLVHVKLLPTGCTRTGHDDISVEEIFTAYPNPTENVLNVSIENSTASEGKLVLYNALGQVITSRSISLTEGRSEESLDLSGLAAGVYSLSFQTSEGNKVQKIVKE